MSNGCPVFSKWEGLRWNYQVSNGVGRGYTHIGNILKSCIYIVSFYANAVAVHLDGMATDGLR